MIRALQSNDADSRVSALRQLRSFSTTPELQAALSAAAAQATMQWERASITCLRVSDRGIPIDRLFEVLPTEPPQSAAWRQEPATCVIDAMAARAEERPARVAPVLAESALSANSPALTDALMRLEPQPLPLAVLVAVGRGNASVRRKAAIRTAVALGAARTAPAAVAEWLDDPDREVRLVAIRALIERIDDASQATAARAVSANPGDAELQRLATARLGTDLAFARHLTALGEDLSAPSFVRAQAAYLVSRGASR